MSTMRSETSELYALVPDWGPVPAGLTYEDAAGVAVGDGDRVYVLTRRPSLVLIFERDGAFVTSWGEGLFTDRTHGITAGPDGGIYCVDDGDQTVRKFTPDGALLLTLGTSGTPSDTGYDGRNVESIQRSAGPFNRPTNVAVGSTGDLYVSDGYGNARVHRFSPQGELLASWGTPGNGPGEFHLVHGIAALPDGRLLVADRENDRIQVFDSDGTYIEQWTDIQRPTHVAFDPRHEVLAVSELGWRAGQRSFVHGKRPDLPSRVSILDTAGSVMDRWGGADVQAPGSFIAAHGIAVDSAGDLYVAEVSWTIGVSQGLVPAGCHTLQKFRR
jgi:DNA-binding beta-propeller fold protein YncE